MNEFQRMQENEGAEADVIKLRHKMHVMRIEERWAAINDE